MQRMKNPHSIRWLTISLCWLLFGLWMSIQSYVAYAQLGRPVSFGYALFVDMSYAFIWLLLTPLSLALSRRFTIEQPRVVPWLVLHIVMAFPVALIHRVLFDVTTGLYRQAFQESPLTWQNISISVIMYLDYGVLVYWLIVALHHITRYYSRYKEKELRSAQLEVELAKARLEALTMQIHPHFLFNTLNAISVLIQTNPAAARSTLNQLSELLRLALDTTNNLVSLKRELEFVRRYLQIEKTRFGERLEVKTDIDTVVLDAQVPALILQPLVENAIRHGVSEQRGKAVIEIRARRNDGTLYLEVNDNGRGLSRGSDNDKRGIGLLNTRSRLSTMYGSQYAFDVIDSEKGGVKATMTIPFRIHEQDQT